jgi:hypothetical protein
LYLPLLLAPIVAYRSSRRVATTLVFLAAFGLMALPWVARNKQVSGVAGFSSASAYNLFYYNAPLFIAYHEQIPAEKALARLEARLAPAGTDDRSLARGPEWIAVATEEIQSAPISYALFHISRTAPFFVGSSLKHALIDLPAVTEYCGANWQVSRINELPDSGAILSALKNEGGIYALERLGWLALFLGGIWAVLFDRRHRYGIALSWLFILYFAALTGPVACARYRLPAEPFLLIAGTMGLQSLLARPWVEQAIAWFRRTGFLPPPRSR